MSTDYSKGFFKATFQYLRETGLPDTEIKLLEDVQGKMVPEIFALALAHAYKRALAIQRGMRLVEEGLRKGGTHLHIDSTCVWFVPQHPILGHDHIRSTYGSTDQEAKMKYVLAHMSLPVPMSSWMREYY